MRNQKWKGNHKDVGNKVNLLILATYQVQHYAVFPNATAKILRKQNFKFN